MKQNTKPISPLRRRMIEDMMLRKLSTQTQAAYIHAVKSFTRFLNSTLSHCNRSRGIDHAFYQENERQLLQSHGLKEN
jgi:hypothetical protein